MNTLLRCGGLSFTIAILHALVGTWPLHGAEVLVSSGAPYVDSKAIKERFGEITAADMEMLRTKKILLASRSFGLNTFKGLTALAREDGKYQILSAYQRYDVFKAGGDVSIVPGDAFKDHQFVHVMATHWPLTKRLEEVDSLLGAAPHEFGEQVDAVIVFYHTCLPEVFEKYQETLTAWRAKYPKVQFIAVTSGFMGPKYEKQNESSFAFGELVRKNLKGIFPLYDMGAILSDDFRVGHVYCPEYSADPAEVHPNLPAGESMMAKGFLLVLKEAFAQELNNAVPGLAASKLHPQPPTKALAGLAASATKSEALSPESSDYKAVRAILDANGLTKKAVEGVSIIEGGRVVGLFLQEGGVEKVPDAIGELSALRKVHLYGDRTLQLPLLNSLSPAIGRCTNIEELLLNQNALTTLPPEIVKLQKLKILSIADNHLSNLPSPVIEWAKRLDPKGLVEQKAE